MCHLKYQSNAATIGKMLPSRLARQKNTFYPFIFFANISQNSILSSYGSRHPRLRPGYDGQAASLLPHHERINEKTITLGLKKLRQKTMKKHIIFLTLISVSFLSYGMEKDVLSLMQLTEARENILGGINNYNYETFKKGLDIQYQSAKHIKTCNPEKIPQLDLLICCAIKSKYEAVQKHTSFEYEIIHFKKCLSNLLIFAPYFILTYLSNQLTEGCNSDICLGVSQVSDLTQKAYWFGATLNLVIEGRKISNATETIAKRKEVIEKIKQDIDTFQCVLGNPNATNFEEKK